MSTLSTQALFKSISEFRGNPTSWKQRAPQAQDLIGSIFDLMGGMDGMVDAMRLEPASKCEHLCNQLAELIGWSLLIEGPHFSDVLSWAHDDAISDCPRLMTKKACDLAIDQLDFAIQNCTPNIMAPSLFDHEQAVKYHPDHFFLFFEKHVGFLLDFNFVQDHNRLARQMNALMSGLSARNFDIIKAKMQRKAIEGHLSIYDVRAAHLFDGEDYAAVFSERFAEVMSDLLISSDHEYIHNAIDQLVDHYRGTPVDLDQLTEAFDHHLDFEDNTEFWPHKGGVSQASYLIEKMQELGVGIRSMFNCFLDLPNTAPFSTLILKAVSLLPDTPKDDFCTKHALWLGALVDMHSVEDLLGMDLDDKTWAKLYIFKGDVRFRDKTQDADYLVNVLSHDLGL